MSLHIFLPYYYLKLNNNYTQNDYNQLNEKKNSQQLDNLKIFFFAPQSA